MDSIGGAISYPGSTRNNKTGSWRTFRPILDEEKCVDCSNCIIFCPEGCVKKKKIDYDYCKGCGICEVECPVKAIKIERE